MPALPPLRGGANVRPVASGPGNGVIIWGALGLWFSYHFDIKCPLIMARSKPDDPVVLRQSWIDG